MECWKAVKLLTTSKIIREIISFLQKNEWFINMWLSVWKTESRKIFEKTFMSIIDVRKFRKYIQSYTEITRQLNHSTTWFPFVSLLEVWSESRPQHWALGWQYSYFLSPPWYRDKQAEHKHISPLTQLEQQCFPGRRSSATGTREQLSLCPSSYCSSSPWPW